jgi:regulator of protease activity HflC (stomatin/prohibitin superfamily)
MVSVAEPAEPQPSSSPLSATLRDPYRSAVLVLLALAVLGAIAAWVGGGRLLSPVLYQTAATLVIASGLLAGVATSQAGRTRPALREPALGARRSSPPAVAEGWKARARVLLHVLLAQLMKGAAAVFGWRLTGIRIATAVAGAVAIFRAGGFGTRVMPVDSSLAATAATLCLVAAALTATAVHYLAAVDVRRFPESVPLTRGGRVLAWVFMLAAVAVGLQWRGLEPAMHTAWWALAILNASVCGGLLFARRHDQQPGVFWLDLGVLSALGARPNLVASVLDAGERQLGIDLRSTWALAVVRRSVEPLVIGLCFLGWLSTSLTVIGPQDEGLVERLGVPVAGAPLSPGLHAHWPWPIDRVFSVPVLRVQSLTVGHESSQDELFAPEDVLWARQHAANEYTLLLGNGRDLITIDASVQYRITDPRAWRYHSQNPVDALRAIAYRAVMRTLVNRTLADALSENVVTTTARIQSIVQEDVNALGLGVEVVDFTVGGMHPPVPVARDYQAVVSAELGKVTAAVNAQADRNQTVPYARSAALVATSTATAEGERARALATGEASAFRALQSQYRAAAGEYSFRRRLETLEHGLASRPFTVVDSRFQRDGGEVWVTP